MRNSLLALSAAGLFLTGCMVNVEPLTETELLENSRSNLLSVVDNQAPVTKPIDIYEAMARAVKYNLDHRVAVFESRLEDQKVNLARSDMLPDLVANVHYSDRDNDPFSFSRSITGAPSANPSVSREAETTTKDLTFSWHILDFGLSYVRAQQAADNSLIAEENRRKVMNRIMEEVRSTYWRAVSADRLLSGFQSLETRVGRAQANSRKLASQGQTSPIAELVFQREMLEIKRQIQRMQQELATAKIELAALMNLRPGQKYSLVLPKRRVGALQLKIDPTEMTRLALLNRPEVRELVYAGRINQLESEAALLEILPGIQLYAGLNADTNTYLLNSDWVSWGAKASWNLLKVFAYPVRKRLIEDEGELVEHRALAMTMAIMTQVEVARANYRYRGKLASTASEYHKVQSAIARHSRESAQADAISEQALIREEMNMLVASAQYDLAYAQLQNAFATIYATIGVDPYGDDFDTDDSLGNLAASLRTTWQERGDLGG